MIRPARSPLRARFPRVLRVSPVLLVSVLTLAGCSFEETVPDSYRCSAAEPACPAGQRCNTALGVCQAEADASTDAPRADLGAPEGGADLPRQDGPAVDSAPADGAMDGPVVDGPVGDAPVGDGQRTDQGAPDTALPDMPIPPDTLPSPDTVPDPECGNGVLEVGEECDGLDFGGATCVDSGYDEGTLSCSNACIKITTGCRICNAPSPPAGVSPDLIVDQATGNNNTAYEDCIAYQTIGAALADAASGDVVWVAYGTYAEAIELPDGVTLVGDEANRGGTTSATYTTISGEAYRSTLKVYATVYSAGSGRISGFRITRTSGSTTNPYGFGGFRSSAVISNNKFYTGTNGIRLSSAALSGAQAEIRNNYLYSGAHGLNLTAASPLVRDNTFASHSTAAVFTNNSANPDLGQLLDPGNNTFGSGMAIIQYSVVDMSAYGNTFAGPVTCAQYQTDVGTIYAANGRVYYGANATQVCPQP